MKHSNAHAGITDSPPQYIHLPIVGEIDAATGIITYYPTTSRYFRLTSAAQRELATHDAVRQTVEDALNPTQPQPARRPCGCGKKGGAE